MEGTKNVYGEPVYDAPKKAIVADYGPAKSQPNPRKNAGPRGAK